jgi:hypothetical protein
MKNNKIFWKKRDIIRNTVPTIPLVISFLGIIILLAMKSLFILFLYILLWIMMNISMAYICKDCIYRGKYCPGLNQLYFGPLISKHLFSSDKVNVTLLKCSIVFLGLFGIGNQIFAFILLFIFYWELKSVIIIILILYCIHIPLSFSIFCPRCKRYANCPVSNMNKIFMKKNV